MSDQHSTDGAERLFPFVLRAGVLLIGRETLLRNKSRLHFVLITTDIAPAIRDEVLLEFKHYPVVQLYTETDLTRFFHIRGARSIGFAKSGLAQSIYAELKAHRLNRPVTPSRPTAPTQPPQPPRTDRPAGTFKRFPGATSRSASTAQPASSPPAAHALRKGCS